MTRKTATPKPRYRSTELLPRRAIVYFQISFQYDNVKEDAEDPERTDELAKKLMADPTGNEVFPLEREAIREVGHLLGVHVVEESSDGNDVHCKFGVSSWEKLKEVWDTISKHTIGGDDVIGLDVPYMEAQQFVFYPRGVNGPRFGPNEKDGDIWQWLEEHVPVPNVEPYAVVNMAPAGMVVATWDDGVTLRRVGTHETILTLELWEPSTRMCKLQLWDFDWHGVKVEGMVSFPTGFELTLSPESDKAIERKYVQHRLDDCRRRLAWFLLRNSPASARSSFPFDIVKQLFLPLHLPAPFAELRADEATDRLAMAVHKDVTSGNVSAHLDVFDRTARLTGAERQEHEDAMVLYFRTAEGAELWLMHGRLGSALSRDDPAEHFPPWRVETEWTEEHGPASWYVVDENQTVVGAGRSPVEALSDVPFLVWPDGGSEWEEIHLRPGQLTWDPEVWLLLGQWPAPMWADPEFRTFVASEGG